ncbi:DUF362 domain-containing protein [bacterium]|nr:DUF362 domain-containing protein [bacterium]
MDIKKSGGFGESYRVSRRMFMKHSAVAAAGTAFAAGGFPVAGAALPGMGGKASVSFVTGNERRDMVGRVLKPFEKEIREGIAGKQVVIKTNFVADGTPLCATHPDAVRGLLDFLAPMYKKEIIIAESTASDKGTEQLFEDYGYTPLKKEYRVKLVELNKQSTSPYYILGKNLRPNRIQVCDTMLDPDNYIFSITRLKTHNVVVATLGLKNIIMGSPQKIYKGVNYKSQMHEMAPWGLNYNMFLVARQIRPQFTILDGLEGMEGNGPIGGTPVNHGVALAGPDVLAVDRIGVELMGIDIADVGYLNYCADAGLGVIDRSQIRIIGSDKPEDHVIKYKLNENSDWQLKWKEDIEIKKG